MHKDEAEIKVAIVEDKPELREGLRALLQGTPGYRFSGAFPSMERALRELPHDLPDALLVDLGLPGMSGIEGIRALKEQHPDLRLVAFTIHDDDAHVFEALCAGASGYLLKKTPPARLLESLREVLAGGAPMSPEIAARVVALFREFRPPTSADYGLTPQETAVLKRLVEGHNYKTAAADMDVSINTIIFHIRNIYRKLEVHSKSEAVAKALRRRLI
jgi:DNA-binding NarL/FixJ family response regulator